jgi:hypothetical protein
MKKNKKYILLAGMVLSVLIFTFLNLRKPDSVNIVLEGVLPDGNIDDRIYRSEIIVIGEIKEVLPSKWNTLETVNNRSLTSRSDVRQLGFGIFTDVIVTPVRFLKGSAPEDSTLRIRSFAGQIEHIRFINDLEPTYQEGQTYLFLLEQYRGAVENHIDPGFYLPIISGTGAFHIENGVAVSFDDGWSLDELVAYIENSPWALMEPNIPEGDETKGIITALERAYEITAKAGHDFNTSNLSSAFVNDSRFTLNPEKLEFTQHFTNNSTLASPGLLDYKLAFYHWWSEYLDNYNNSEWTNKWGHAWDAEKTPEQDYPLRIVSIEIHEEFSIAYLYDGRNLVELYLVKIDEKWYVAGEPGVTTIPDMLLVDSAIEEPVIIADTPTFISTPTELVTETPLPAGTPTITP